MSEVSKFELVGQFSRLRRLRLPLLLALLFNVALVLRVPISQSRSAGPDEPAGASATSAPAAVATTTADSASPGEIGAGESQASTRPSADREATPAAAAAAATPARPATDAEAPAAAALVGRTLRGTMSAGLRQCAEQVRQFVAARDALPRDPWDPATVVVGPNSPAATPTPETLAIRLSLSNPARNGGLVRFVVNQEVTALAAGESRDWPAGDASWTVRFHRGADFGNAEFHLAAGEYQFVVTPTGWDLAPTAPPLSP